MSRSQANKEAGFTLVELMIVVLVIGILAAIAIPNYNALRRNSIRAACLSNQRNIVQGATLYSIEQGVESGSLNVTTLEAGSYVNDDVSECPASSVLDSDDYTIVLSNNRVSSITCDVETTWHQWSPP